MNQKRNKKFIRDVTLVAAVIALLVTGAVAYFVSQVGRSISERYIREAADRAVAEFDAMTGSIEASLTMVRDWGRSGLISISEPEKLNGLLSPIIRKERLLSGISVADTEGGRYFILSDGTEILSGEDPDYDPRERPWFGPTLKTDKVYWSDLYLFHTLQELGVTASVSFIPDGREIEHVVAFDILLTDLYLKIERLAPSANSDTFLFQEEHMLMIPGDDPGFFPVQSISNPLLGEAHAYWRQGRGTDEEVFSFLHQGEVWWGGFKPMEDSRRDVWMGIIVPESDIIGDIGRRRAAVIGFGAVVILLLAGGVGWLAHRYGRMDGSDAISRIENPDVLRSLIDKGETRKVEFKSTIRMNLHSKKPGKEIELAWLKAVSAFLNTDGGTLLLGVTDAGEITGIERDVFENEDKCRLHFKNLIANHIGAEMSKHIRLELVPVDDKTVGVVHCSRSAEPVFLKDGSKEHFYIRNGPASDELPVSKALQYIRSRKKD